LEPSRDIQKKGLSRKSKGSQWILRLSKQYLGAASLGIRIKNCSIKSGKILIFFCVIVKIILIYEEKAKLNIT